jgi:hypothetical protein
MAAFFYILSSSSFTIILTLDAMQKLKGKVIPVTGRGDP